MKCNVLFCTIHTHIVFVFPLLRHSHSNQHNNQKSYLKSHKMDGKYSSNYLEKHISLLD